MGLFNAAKRLGGAVKKEFTDFRNSVKETFEDPSQKGIDHALKRGRLDVGRSNYIATRATLESFQEAGFKGARAEQVKEMFDSASALDIRGGYKNVLSNLSRDEIKKVASMQTDLSNSYNIATVRQQRGIFLSKAFRGGEAPVPSASAPPPPRVEPTPLSSIKSAPDVPPTKSMPSADLGMEAPQMPGELKIGGFKTKAQTGSATPPSGEPVKITPSDVPPAPTPTPSSPPAPSIGSRVKDAVTQGYGKAKQYYHDMKPVVEEKAGQLYGQAKEAAVATKERAQQAYQETAPIVKGKANQLYGQVQDTAAQGYGKVKQYYHDMKPVIEEKAGQLYGQAKDAAGNAAVKIKQGASAAKEHIKETLTAAPRREAIEEKIARENPGGLATERYVLGDPTPPMPVSTEEAPTGFMGKMKKTIDGYRNHEVELTKYQKDTAKALEGYDYPKAPEGKIKFGDTAAAHQKSVYQDTRNFSQELANAKNDEEMNKLFESRGITNITATDEGAARKALEQFQKNRADAGPGFDDYMEAYHGYAALAVGTVGMGAIKAFDNGGSRTNAQLYGMG